jgi:hypothetical protein
MQQNLNPLAESASGEPLIPMPSSVSSLIGAYTTRIVRSLYPRQSASGLSFQESLLKDFIGHTTHNVSDSGEVPHPIDYAAAKRFVYSNENHSACIVAKQFATVGLGHLDSQLEEQEAKASGEISSRKVFVESRADTILDKLCVMSWADTLLPMAEDLYSTHNGYFEVVRSGSGISGIHHFPAERCVKVMEPGGYFHWKILSDNGTEARWADFGDREGFLARRLGGDPITFGNYAVPEDSGGSHSEILHFRIPSASSRHYGIPTWISAVPAIELVQMLMQYRCDFFVNRGVPEFVFLLKGSKLSAADWKLVENSLKAHIGLGNSHKTLALNLPSSEVELQIEKLAGEESEGFFPADRESLAVSIVIAHRVPGQLVGLLIPGKLGSNNQGPTDLMMFQILNVGPVQRMIQMRLSSTIGKELGLTSKDFAFARIVDEIPMGAMDTLSRMRQDPVSSGREGRDLGAGVRD